MPLVVLESFDMRGLDGLADSYLQLMLIRWIAV
jgi:hypothetical protein